MAPIELIELCRGLGNPANDLCIQAEGNASARGTHGTLWIKGSGYAMHEITADAFAQVRPQEVNQAVSLQTPLGEREARALLDRAKVDRSPAKPSTETFMHAHLLEVCGADFVAHTHPTPLLSLLVLPDAEQWALRRLFPDEIVLCGPASCWVPYVAPGLPLAQAIQRQTESFRDRFGILPKTYWLQNHGLIVTGKTWREALSGTLMAVKAARVLLGTLQTGATPRWLTDAEVDQIYRWPDEHARQRQLWG